MHTIRICILLVSVQIIFFISAQAQETDKRVPHGFVGMRGKKYLDSAEMEQFYKRKPQFFVGVKGKKNIYDLYENNELYYKRAPTGFVGMRGKKEYMSPDPIFAENYRYAPRIGGSLVGQIDYSTNEDLKSSSADVSLINELLKKYLQKFAHSDSDTEDLQTNSPAIEDQADEGITNEVEKRVANIHQFFGVRGKKSVQNRPMQNKRPYDLTFRGKFIGVRGKKDVNTNDAQEIRFLLGQNGPWPKRRTQMGFFGMRGKKWTDDLVTETETSKV